MVTKNGELGPDVNNHEKSSKEELKSMDFLKQWFEIKKQTDIIKDKSKLADLKEDVLESMWYPKISDKFLDGPRKLPELSDKNVRNKYSALASIETRSPKDRDKTATSGILTSVLAPFQAAGRILFDTGKLVRSPRKEVQNTLAYLKEESPNTEIV